MKEELKEITGFEIGQIAYHRATGEPYVVIGYECLVDQYGTTIFVNCSGEEGQKSFLPVSISENKEFTL